MNKHINFLEFSEAPEKMDLGVLLQARMLEEEHNRSKADNNSTCLHCVEVDGGTTVGIEGFMSKMFGKKDRGPNQHSIELLDYLDDKLANGKIAEEVIEYRAHGSLANIANGKRMAQVVANLETGLKMADNFEKQLIAVWGEAVTALEKYAKDDDLNKLKATYEKYSVQFKPEILSGWVKGGFLKGEDKKETPHYDIKDSTETFCFAIYNNADSVNRVYPNGLPTSRVMSELRWINEPDKFYRYKSDEYKHLFRITRKDAEDLAPSIRKLIKMAIEQYGQYNAFYDATSKLAERLVTCHNRDTTRIPVQTSRDILGRIERLRAIISDVIFQIALLVRQYVTLVY